MMVFKDSFHHQMQSIKKEKIKWEFIDNQANKYKGEYEGELKEGRPHGIGRWKRDEKH